MITLTENPTDYNLPYPSWYENQRGMVEKTVNLNPGQVLILEAPTGCHRAGQSILMWDGSTKPVELVETGDILMGPDSRPRYVLRLIRGVGQMYQITPVKGSSFVVNKDHILTLVRTGKKRPGQRKDCRWGEIIDVRVCDYLNWSKTQKHLYKLFRTGVDFPYQYRLEIEPYFLGALLGDGSLGWSHGIGITTEDQEIVQEFYRQAGLRSLRVRFERKPDNKAASYYFTGPGCGRTNYFAYYLENMGLRGTTCGGKFIPHKYRTATRQDRLELLAGLLDTDGHLSNNCYDYISKSKQLSEDFAFVARSLGFAAYVAECQKADQWGHEGTYFRVSLSGDVSSIPCRLPRKQASRRRQKKDVLRTGFKCKKLGTEGYFGFTLGPSDGRFLLGDFTVTHNTGKSACPVAVSHFRPGTTVCMGTRDLQEQYRVSFDDVEVAWGQEHYPCINEEHKAQFIRAYDEQPSRADCPFRRGSKDCPIGSQCPYEQAKTAALAAEAKVLNYALAFYTKWWRPYTNDLFCDEAHRLPGILSSLVSLEVANRTRKWYDLDDFPYTSGGTSYAYGQIQSWAKMGAAHLGTTERAVRDPKRRLQHRRMRLKLESLVKMLDKAEPGAWYVASGQSVGKLMAKPIFPGRYAKTILDGNARSITLMSATIGDPALLAEELGLTQDFEFLSLPHIFPKENRVIIWVKESPRLSRKSTENDYKAQAEIIARILNSHRGQKGLIHTVSWKHTELLKDLLGRTHGHRLYIPKGEERVKAVERFKNSNGDTVVISPSWYEGLNFPDDEARFAIIAKVPYLSLADPVVKLRLKSKGGGRWYRWQAALRIVQAAGRIVRHRDDWGITYIVDSEWSRVSKFAPEWFEVESL